MYGVLDDLWSIGDIVVYHRVCDKSLHIPLDFCFIQISKKEILCH